MVQVKKRTWKSN